jgi:uncharacterized protein YjbI with pentapeptide repeats
LIGVTDSAGASNPPAAALSRAPLPRWTVPVVAGVVLVIAGVVLVVLWRWVDGLALADAEQRATAHLDVIKTASAIAVGGGGVFALYLAARRQRTQELELQVRRDELRNRQVELEQRDRAQRHAEEVAEANGRHAEQVAGDGRHDAAERRVTEIYTKAAEQFGSDNITVQLAGLYGFERLADDQPRMRQTVVNVICSLLRMPVTDSGDATARSRNAQVRSAAQRILIEHLRPSPESASATFWDVGLDLSKATLEDFSLTGCHVRKAVFTETTFTGTCDFTGLATGEELDLVDATFDGPVLAAAARVGGDLVLDGTLFRTEADFHGLRVTGAATLTGTRFAAGVTFQGAAFEGAFRCADARFSAAAMFAGATFRESVEIESTAFAGEVNYRGADFFGATRISSSTFADEVWFVKAEFSAGTPLFSHVVFNGDAWLHAIGLRNGILFDRVSFAGAADLSDCENAVANDVRARRVPLYRDWPTTWRVSAVSADDEGQEWEALVDDAGPSRLEYPDVLWNFAQD